jgi:hypothetical protein
MIEEASKGEAIDCPSFRLSRPRKLRKNNPAHKPGL